MYEIVIRCPETGLPVETGEKTIERTVPRSIGGKTLSRCPACNGAHVWLAREAWLVPESDDGVGTDDAELL